MMAYKIGITNNSINASEGLLNAVFEGYDGRSGPVSGLYVKHEADDTRFWPLNWYSCGINSHISTEMAIC